MITLRGVIMIMELFYGLARAAGRKFDENDRAGNVLDNVGSVFNTPLSASTKIVVFFILVGSIIVAAYVTFRIIKHIWHSDDKERYY
jgi:hypothetical protein